MAVTGHITDTTNSDDYADECPYSEFGAGRDDGMRTALWAIRDRAEYLRLLAALERSRAAFLIELRTAQYVVDDGRAAMPLDEFETLMFGTNAGGVQGAYAHGFMASFAVVAPFVASLH